MESYIVSSDGYVTVLDSWMERLLEDYFISGQLEMFYICVNRSIEDADGAVLMLIQSGHSSPHESTEEAGFLETIYQDLSDKVEGLKGIGWFADDYLRCYYNSRFYRFNLEQQEQYECFVQIYDKPPTNQTLALGQNLLLSTIETYNRSLDKKIGEVFNMLLKQQQVTLIGRLDFLSGLLKIDSMADQSTMDSSTE